MGQLHHDQEGTFHVTTNARNFARWLTLPGVPEVILDNLMMSKHLYGAKLYAFCILPDHMHFIVNIHGKGLSRFIQSFKSQTIRDLRHLSGKSRLSADNEMYRIARFQKSFHSNHISSERELENALSYVHYNAHRHGLVENPLDWPWSSLKYPDLLDGWNL